MVLLLVASKSISKCPKNFFAANQGNITRYDHPHNAIFIKSPKKEEILKLHRIITLKPCYLHFCICEWMDGP